MAGFRATGYRNLVRVQTLDELRHRALQRRAVDDYIRRAAMQSEAEAYIANRLWEQDQKKVARWYEQASEAIRRESLKRAANPKSPSVLSYDNSFAVETMKANGLGPSVITGSPANTPRNSEGGFFRAKHWRPYDPPARRLNPNADLFGGSSTAGTFASGGNTGKRMGAGTFFSRFADNKHETGARGIFNVSSSRMRSMKSFVGNPAAFANRSLVFWAATEMSRAYQNYRGWHKVNYWDNPVEARATLDKHNGKMGTGERLARGASATVGGFVSNLSLPMLGVGASLFSLQWGVDETETARFMAQASAWADYFGSGGIGQAPTAANLNRARNRVEERIRNDAYSDALVKYENNVRRTIDRMKDAFAMRGVGNMDMIRSAFDNSESGRQYKFELVKAANDAASRAAKNVNGADIKRAMGNRD